MVKAIDLVDLSTLNQVIKVFSAALFAERMLASAKDNCDAVRLAFTVLIDVYCVSVAYRAESGVL